MSVPAAILQKQKELFLHTLARTGNVTASAKAAGWGYPTIAQRHRDDDEGFAEAWLDAHAQSVDAMEAEARRRAVEGVDEPVYYKGEMVGSVRKYSDKLLELLLKANRPEKFTEFKPAVIETPGVLVVPQAPQTVDDWESNATTQQQKLLSDEA